MDDLTIARSLGTALVQPGKGSLRTSPALKVGQADHGTPVSIHDIAGPDLPANQAKNAVDRADVEAAVAELNLQFEVANRSLRFRIDDRTDRLVVSVIDDETGDVVRQIPPEVTIRIAANRLDSSGLLTNVLG